ncbi:MAG: hypothetical protein LBC19_00980 [Tannerella sp.]|jgi:hypothetical protein|nr:hypothetical protein [Tannerella sp.]
MKVNLFWLLAVLSCFQVSCGNDPPEEEACNDMTLPFRYSIIIKDKDGLVLLGDYYDGNILNRYFYWERDIRLIPYPPDSNREPVFSIRKYDGEYRITVGTEFNECRQGGGLGMILEFVEVWHLAPVAYHKYTYDTIQCVLKVVNDSVVCEKISVNDILSWENKAEEPYLTLVKNKHSFRSGSERKYAGSVSVNNVSAGLPPRR